MDGLSVTHLWMGGVVGMMLAFGAVALVGYIRQKSGKTDES